MSTNGNIPDYFTLPDISEKQQRAIELLLVGTKQIDIAKELDIQTETISRWRLNSHFVAALNAARLARWHHTQERLQDLSEQAIDTLTELLQSPTDATRLAALKLYFSSAALEKPAAPINVERVEKDLKKEHKVSSVFDIDLL